MSSYYHIKPIEEMGNSWRWFVDEAGLEYAKNKYQKYEKRGIIKDRWNEFVYEEVKEIYCDFGGMACTKEPSVSIKDDGIQYTMKVHHLPYFIEALQWDGGDEKYKIAGITSILMKWWRIAIALETGNRVLMKALELQKNCEEMLEGVNRNWEEFYELMAKNKHLIRIQPPHGK